MSEFPKAAEVWNGVSSDLVSGLVHALNNRIAALDGILGMLEDGETVDAQSQVQAESERMRTLTTNARRIAAESRAQAEACTVKDLFAATIALATLHPALSGLQLDVRGAEAMPAIRLRQRRAEHALLLAVLAARDGRKGPLVATCSATTDTQVEIMLRSLEPGNDESASATTESLCAAADAIVHDDGGEVELQVRAVRTVSIRLPGLSRSGRE